MLSCIPKKGDDVIFVTSTPCVKLFQLWVKLSYISCLVTILSEIDYPGTECICLTCVCYTFRFVHFVMEHFTFNDNSLFSCESKAATLVFVKTEDGCL